MTTAQLSVRSFVLSMLGLHVALTGALAQVATSPDNWDCSTNHLWKNNGVVLNYNKPVDLDQDGKADFRLINADAYAVDPFLPPTNPLYSYLIDNTLAYFAEKHVQMYLQPVSGACATDLPEAVLASGTRISANPSTSSSWQWTSPHEIPSLQGIGFGQTIRSQTFTDPHIPGGGWEPSYLHAAHAPILTNAIFGFRLPSADGWHTGWMRIRWADTDLTIDNVKMIEFAVSPTPDTDIIAGVHVGAPLQIAMNGTNGTSLRISWPSTATNLILETKPDLGATNWLTVTVQGVTNNEVSIQPTNATSFYRLRGLGSP